MSRSDLARRIVNNKHLIFAHKPLPVEDLLAKAHDLILDYKLRDAKELLSAIRSCFGLPASVNRRLELNLSVALSRGLVGLSLDPAWREYATWLWEHKASAFLHELAPAGYYFGLSDTNPSCMGWFPLKQV